MAGDDISIKPILVAEDDASHQKIISLMLSRLGYKSDVVSNGHEAIHAVERSQYNLVLMDIVMPKMDGLEATREIRKLNQNGLKIIAITAYVFPGIRDICLEAGMDDCITKPVRIKDLECALKNIGHLENDKFSRLFRLPNNQA
jgi:two-component system sensor histidine kinase/response regulator